MYRKLLILCCAFALLAGCGFMRDEGAAVSGASGGGLFSKANAFNPFLNSKLPNTRVISGEGKNMLSELGAGLQSIEGEARHRSNWRGELYPVVFGSSKAAGEVLVILNFASAQSEEVWEQVVAASRSMNPSSAKIVVFGRSSENYGTDLMGLAIWIAHARKGQAMGYLSYALKRWNEVKGAQKRAGTRKNFVNEYDATASENDYPILYGYFSRLKPPVTGANELAVAKYCYGAGNVNMYQAEQVARYYGVKSLPAVIVNGAVLGRPDAAAILKALNG